VERLILALLVIFLAVLTACTTTISPEANTMEKSKNSMIISSPAFLDNTMIPRKYTCQGDDINPPLEFSGIPSGTKSLVLIVDDPDAPMGTWDHWILFNVHVISKIEEDNVPPGAVQGTNSWGNNSYGGPCPPTGTHRYVFKLYALDSPLDLNESSSKQDVLNAMKAHLLAQAQLIGLYRKT